MSRNSRHIVDTNGHQKWFQDRKLHREDGPAAIWPDGTQEWYLDGKSHRCDGPAVIYPDGTQEWWQNGQRHREDGPAIIRSDGYQAWYRCGMWHRLDGPAVINDDGSEEWYLDNILIEKPILIKISPKTISVFGPMVSESYEEFGGTRDGLLIIFPTEEDALLWLLKEK